MQTATLRIAVVTGLVAAFGLPLAALGEETGGETDLLPPTEFRLEDLIIEARIERLTMTISGDGTIRLCDDCGMVSELGYEYKIPPQRVLALLGDFDKTDFYTLRSLYDREGYSFGGYKLTGENMVVRQPDYLAEEGPAFTLRIGEFEKTVVAARWCPRQLKTIVKKVLELAEETRKRGS